jgi:DNA primase
MNDPVLDLLNKHNLAYQTSGRDYLIHCLNPEHPDSNPSFRVDKVSGVAHCFSCGFKTNVFKFFGVFSNPVPIKVAQLKEKLLELKTLNQGLEPVQGHTPWTKSFRNISPQTLKHFGAFYTTQVEKLADRIVFPITDVTNKTVAFVGRHTLSQGNPRYVNYPSKVKLPIFPSYLPTEYNSLVLVEGIFDMLNLYSLGLKNSACVFGTNTLQNNTKEKLMPFKAQGVTHIYLMFDGDESGRKAAQMLKPLIEAENFVVEIISLPDGTDPGELDQESVQSILEYITH